MSRNRQWRYTGRNHGTRQVPIWKHGKNSFLCPPHYEQLLEGSSRLLSIASKMPCSLDSGPRLQRYRAHDNIRLPPFWRPQNNSTHALAGQKQEYRFRWPKASKCACKCEAPGKQCSNRWFKHFQSLRFQFHRDLFRHLLSTSLSVARIHYTAIFKKRVRSE